MNVLLLTSHSIAEYDDLRMLSDLGYDVFSIGAYTNPGQPGDDKRPALPDVPYHAGFEALCWEQRARHDGDDPGFVIDWAKGDLHPAIVDWADAIIVHHFPEAWIAGQWDRIRDKRVIWRTCGQSDPRLEAAMARLDGLGALPYDEMRDYLRRIRAYLYTGTQPASYTLGLIEAMMTGVPVVSIGPSWMTWQRGLFEGHEIACEWSDDPAFARRTLAAILEFGVEENVTRERAIELFGIETVGPQWREFLG
jgi:glycosyltransferase involved in cell wall biosynthesis